MTIKMGISAGIGGGKIPTLQVKVPEVIQSKATHPTNPAAQISHKTQQRSTKS